MAHPVLLPDGTLLAAAGYDRRSGLLVHLPRGLEVRVPDRPTKADVGRAVATLFDVLHDFPFETEAHKASLVAGLLTPLAYHMFEGPAPLFLIDGNVRGVGKGLLADVLSYTLAGRRFPVMSYTHDQDELRKRITTIAVEAERQVLFDNLSGSFGGGTLDAALTTDWWKDRLLGSNRGYDGPLHVTWFATGNNVQLVGDTARRVCHVRMESREERPELKDNFRYQNLREHVRANRGSILNAALTILRGWVVAGRPRQGLKAWGSFEGWSAVVREAVKFADLPDPGDTREALQTNADREAMCMEVIVTNLNGLDASGGKGVTVADLVARLKGWPLTETEAEVKSAAEELCGKLDARQLGYKFRHFKRRNFNNWVLDLAGEDRLKGVRWKAKPADGVFCGGKTSPASPASPAGGGSAAGDAGDAGDGSAWEKIHPEPSRPVWEDSEAFYELTTTAGLQWPQVVSWLNDKHRAGLPAGTGFFDTPARFRQVAAEWMATLPKGAK